MLLALMVESKLLLIVLWVDIGKNIYKISSYVPGTGDRIICSNKKTIPGIATPIEVII